MKKATLFLSLTGLLISCSVSKLMKSIYGDHYEYKYEMIAPSQDTALVFTDSAIDIRFSFSDKQIDFVIKNKSNDPLKIIWDEASIVQYGKTKNIIHKGVKYIEAGKSMTPTTLLPGAALDDLIVPAEKVEYESGTYGGWRVNDFFVCYDENKPENKSVIMANVGQEVSVYIPIRTGSNKELGYIFKFKVNDISCTTCKLKN